MNIWLICKYASPQKYFFGTRHFYFAEEWVKRGHQVTIFTSTSSHLSDRFPEMQGRFFFEIINGVHTFFFNTIKSKGSSSISRILSWFHFEWQVLSHPKKKMQKPDVIIVSSLSLLSVISGLYLSRKYKSRFILEIRDIWPLSAMLLGGLSKWNPFILFLSFIEKLGYRKADVIVGTMPNLEEHVKAVVPGKYHRCVCIPQGINLEFYEHQEKLDDDYIQKNIPADKFIISYAGTLNTNNPIVVLLEAARKMASNKKIHFIVLGSGNKKQGYVEEYGNLENITFLDPVPKAQVNHFLSFVDVCFDSVDSELGRYGLSRNKWIDYMFAAKPLICSFSGFQSMINEAQSGSFTPYGEVEALVREIEKYAAMPPAELKAMGERAKKYILENRTFDKLAKQYEDLFYV